LARGLAVFGLVIDQAGAVVPPEALRLVEARRAARARRDYAEADRLRTVIEGGWVVAWNGRSHEVHEQGSVMFEGDRIVHAGPAWTGAADTRIAARGKLVSPGFINTHVHTA